GSQSHRRAQCHDRPGEGAYRAGALRRVTEGLRVVSQRRPLAGHLRGGVRSRLGAGCHGTAPRLGRLPCIAGRRETRAAQTAPPVTAPTAPALFVTGTDTGVGKTRIAAALCRAFAAAGLRVAAMKPVAS